MFSGLKSRSSLETRLETSGYAPTVHWFRQDPIQSRWTLRGQFELSFESCEVSSCKGGRNHVRDEIFAARDVAPRRCALFDTGATDKQFSIESFGENPGSISTT